MDADNGPVRPVGAGDYQPPRKRASAPQPEDYGRPLSLPDQVAAVRQWQSEQAVEPLGDQPARKLAHGLDTLHVTYDVDWEDRRGEGSEPGVWAVLDEAKARAAGEHPEQVGTAEEGVRQEHGVLVRLPVGLGWGDLLANVMPSGANGYRWLLRGHGIVIKIGRQVKAGSRPNVMAEIGSHACWHHGGREIVVMIEKMIARNGGKVQTIKPSRCDMCVDLLLPDDVIDRQTDQQLVTRARSYALHADIRKPVHGVTVGAGQVMLRMYDKPKEIADKGGLKAWMYDVWRIPPGDRDARGPDGQRDPEKLDANIPEGHRIIRVEFQLRREALKELGAETFEQFIDRAASLWSYLTDSWCRLVERPDVKRDRQTVLPWWAMVYDGWPMTWAAVQAIRAGRPSQETRQLAQGAAGYLSSLLAASRAGKADPADMTDQDIDAAVAVLRAELEQLRDGDPDDLTADVLAKLAKHDKGVRKLERAIRQRRAHDQRAAIVRAEQTERALRVDDGSAQVADRLHRRTVRQEQTAEHIEKLRRAAERAARLEQEKAKAAAPPPPNPQTKLGFG